MATPRKNRSISLKELSDMAGVSRCTASRILNRHPDFTFAEDTVKRVFQIAQDHGYRTSQLYKSLFSGKTKSVGVISPNSLFYSRITKGLHDRLLQDDYAMIMGVNALDYDTPVESIEKKIIHRLNEHRVDGFIMRPTLDDAKNEHFAEIIETGIPLVVIDREVKAEYADFVGSDNLKGGRIAAEYLVGLGHKNILQLAGNQLCSVFRDRTSGFENALIESGIIPQTIFCKDNDEITEKCKKLFSLPNHPTAVFCSSDGAAGVVYNALFSIGLKIPDDVSVMGYGNQLISEYFYPSLSSIEQYPYEIGVKAVELFMERLAHDPNTPREKRSVYMDVSLVINDSCRAI